VSSQWKQTWGQTRRLGVTCSKAEAVMRPPETRYAKVFVPSFEQERWYCEAV